MSKFVSFVLYNILMYLVYRGIDKVFDSLDWYSNPALGNSIMIMPTGDDVWLIFANIICSSIISLYLLYKIKGYIDSTK